MFVHYIYSLALVLLWYMQPAETPEFVINHRIF